jgi:serine/threonine protein kinase
MKSSASWDAAAWPTCTWRTDSENGGTVALKLIEHAADADTIAAIEAERRGAELQAHLAAIDPRVVRVYGAGDADGFFFVAMEYIDGQDLAELMRHGSLAVEFATDTAIAVAKTLEHAHNLEIAIDGKSFRGVVHGDIKPKNIRIDARGEVRVLDFGIAKALSMSRRLTRNEFGSVPYASPERLDSGDVNVGSDLWSLAVMLYEMVTGLQPYQAGNTEWLERMIRSRIAPPPAPDPCPEPLRRILIKAMAPNPALRYASAQEFGADLEAFQAGTPVAAASEDLDATRRTFRPPTDAAGTTWTPRGAPAGEPPRRKHGERRAVAQTRGQTTASTRRKRRALGHPSLSPPSRRRPSPTSIPCASCWDCSSPASSMADGRSPPTTCSTGTASNWRVRLKPNSLPTSTRFGTGGRNFPGAMLRLSYCTDREKW